MGSKKKARACQRKIKAAAKSSQVPPPQEDEPDKNLTLMANNGITDAMMDGATLETKESKLSRLLCQGFHPSDQPLLLCDYMRTRKTIDSKTLVKHMPNLCRDLREGKISLLGVSTKVTLEFSKHNPSFRFTSWDMLDRIGSRMADIILEPFPDHRKLLLESEIDQFRKALSQANRLVSLDFVDSEQKVAKKNGPFYIASKVKFAAEQACRDFEDLFDRKLCGNIKGEFRRRYPLSGMTLEQFLTEFMVRATEEKDNRDDFGHIQADIFAAAEGVTKGVLEGRNCCWECGSIPPSKLLICGRCNFASYCSQSCQKEAWKKGHKETCLELRVHKERLEVDIQTIVAKKEKSEVMSDFFCLANRVILEPPLSFVPGLGEPSMKIFYRNLDLVRQGKLWVVENPTPLDSYLKELASSGIEAEIAERNVLNSIVSLLGYEVLSFEECSNLYNVFAEDFGQPGSTMPVERFLHLYGCARPEGIPVDHKTNWKRHQRFVVKSIEATLRSWYEYNGELAAKVRSAYEDDSVTAAASTGGGGM